MWQSLFEDRDLLKKRPRWRLETDSTTGIYRVNWLPHVSDLQVCLPISLPPSNVMDSLISIVGSWDSDLLVFQLTSDEARLIQSIPIGG